jgi:hypothetical protein
MVAGVKGILTKARISIMRRIIKVGSIFKLWIAQSFLTLAASVSIQAAPGDADNDGLRDEVETNTGVYVSATNTGTNPNLSDSDGDSLPDGLEVNNGKNPNDPLSTLKRPNIIYILADDMGYGDVGCFGQNQRTGIWKFATPGLDSMAAQGAKLTCKLPRQCDI